MHEHEGEDDRAQELMAGDAAPGREQRLQPERSRRDGASGRGDDERGRSAGEMRVGEGDDERHRDDRERDRDDPAITHDERG